ncbi:DNA gyrase inhibitor YacG [Mesorhizobium sp. VNQ89]|uniref:DNA gyrase inhibitor YacG n=1 Tax=Mesorhizobium quangtriensis TaxID=3157709 RepID=UPI0032B87049
MKSPGATVTPLRPKRPCPECGNPSSREHYPFCSPRCKNVDLNRWLTGAYVIPGRDDEDEVGKPESPSPGGADGQD